MTKVPKSELVVKFREWFVRRYPNRKIDFDDVVKILTYNHWSLMKSMAYVGDNEHNPVPSETMLIKMLFDTVNELIIRVVQLEAYLIDRDNFEDSGDEDEQV